MAKKKLSVLKNCKILGFGCFAKGWKRICLDIASLILGENISVLLSGSIREPISLCLNIL